MWFTVRMGFFLIDYTTISTTKKKPQGQAPPSAFCFPCNFANFPFFVIDFFFFLSTNTKQKKSSLI